MIEPSRPKRRWLRRAWWLVAALTGVAVLAVAGTVFVLDRSLTRVDVQGLGEAPLQAEPESVEPANGTDELPVPDQEPDLDLPDEATDALTILLLGSDTREVLTPEERRELGTGNAEGERTEVVSLLRLDPARDETRMVQIPRDSLVERCDGTRGRINAAYGIGEREGIGGMSCTVQTVAAWSGLTIDHAAKVDFRGFVDIVDAIGGVEMWLDEPMYDRRANLDLEAGCVHLDGADALAFVRARHLDDDFGRIARQHRFIHEVRAQAGELGLIQDLRQVVRLAEAAARSLELDDTLSLGRIRHLVMSHRAALTGPIETRTVPGTPDEQEGFYFLQPDEAAAAELFAWLRDGDPTPDDATGPDGEPATDAGEGDPADTERRTPEREPGSGATGPDASTPPAPGEHSDPTRAPDDAPVGATPQRCGLTGAAPVAADGDRP